MILATAAWQWHAGTVSTNEHTNQTPLLIIFWPMCIFVALLYALMYNETAESGNLDVGGSILLWVLFGSKPVMACAAGIMSQFMIR